MRRLVTGRLVFLLSATFASDLGSIQLVPSSTVQHVSTASGVRFGVLGQMRQAPSPTLFIFATNFETSLADPNYARVGHILAQEGYLCVSLDLPSHGEDLRANEPQGLQGWQVRLDNLEDFLPGFLAKVSDVLDHLIRAGFTDPARIAVCGTSRGGFIALHAAAKDSRIQCVAAFAPVTNLAVLKQFQGASENPLVKNYAVTTKAEALASNAVWIMIGNDDTRVNTDDAIALARGIVKAGSARKKTAQIQLHLMPSEGHRTPPTAHEDAARWILSILGSGRSVEKPAPK